MKIKGNEKCHACPRVLASVVFRYPVFCRYSGIPLSFRGGPAVPLVFRIPLFRCSVSIPCSVFRCSWFYSMLTLNAMGR